jgi:DNA-directed RNA polymerase specialized sigma24 family protein
MEWSGDEKELLDDPGFLQVLDQCMEGLPERSKAVLSAKYFEKKKGGLICQEMGLSSSNYWQLVRRAKLMLRDCLATKWFNR